MKIQCACLLFFLRLAETAPGITIESGEKANSVVQRLKEATLDSFEHRRVSQEVLFVMLAHQVKGKIGFFQKIDFVCTIGAPITIFDVSLKKIPAYDALLLIELKGERHVEIHSDKIVLLPRQQTMFPMQTKIFDIPPSFFQLKEATGIVDVRDKLEKKGIRFFEKSKSSYDFRAQKLSVTNIQHELAKLEFILR
jgi:hypothetical protein